jgi:hypothetical protein
MQTGVDNLHAGIAQSAGHHFGTAVMAVEACLSHHHPNWPAWGNLKA